MIQEDFKAVIDIGTTKVVALLGKRTPSGNIETAAVGVAPCQGLQKGVVADQAATAEAIRDAVRQVSEQAGVSVRAAYVGLSGSHIQSANRWDKVHETEDVRVITQEDMEQAERVVKTRVAGQQQHLLHVLPRAFALDGRHMVNNPLGMHAAEMHAHSHVITGDPDSIRALTAAVEAAGLSVAGLIVEPIASAEATLSPVERDEGAVLLDIGGGTTDIAVFMDGHIAYTNVLPVGGWQFSNDLVVGFRTSFEQAEEIKLAYGSVTPEGSSMREEIEIPTQARDMEGPLVVTRREIAQIMKDRAYEMLRLVRRRLISSGVDEAPMERLVLTGGGAKLDGMQGLARYVFQGNVRTAAPRAIDGLPEEYEDPQYSASVGMLVWGTRHLKSESHVRAFPRATGESAVEEVERPRKLFGIFRAFRRGAAKDTESPSQRVRA
ncbi:MAG: cell division protein FtsA [Chloroflexota bacterium]